MYLADPLTCAQCGGRLRIAGFIDPPGIVEKLLRHLKLWNLPERFPQLGRRATWVPDPDSLQRAATARQFDRID